MSTRFREDERKKNMSPAVATGPTLPPMDAVLLFGAIGAAIAIGALAIALVHSRDHLRSKEREVQRAAGSLDEQRRNSDEGRRIQDLILGSMEEGVLLLDSDGRRVFANDALGRHLRDTPDGIDALMPVELQRAAKRAGYTGATTYVEVETGVPIRWLRITALPVGNDGSVLIVARDVTESRRLDAVRRDFVTNASHELKTPVASIRAAAETIRDAAADDPPAVRRFADQLEREAMRLQRIVTDLLDLSRLESGSDLDERVRLDDVVLEEVHRLQETAKEAGLTLTYEADGLPSVRGSAGDLALLVRNLVDNAIRYTRPGGTIRVGLSGADDTVRLTVTDTGLGIPTKDLPRVFERFYRVDRARSRETGGTGLGLAIVKHVAENHGGSVDVTSELGRGSTFVVTLPAAHDA
jgi:two-component system sensor histidine kinase SenX3